MYKGEINKSCALRFDVIEGKLTSLEQKNEKRLEKESVIEKAIIEIQVSSQLTAKTLAKLEERFEKIICASTQGNKVTNDKWFKLFEKIILVGAGIIGALLGQKIL